MGENRSWSLLAGDAVESDMSAMTEECSLAALEVDGPDVGGKCSCGLSRKTHAQLCVDNGSKTEAHGYDLK
jgi:hypothetical protein